MVYDTPTKIIMFDDFCLIRKTQLKIVSVVGALVIRSLISKQGSDKIHFLLTMHSFEFLFYFV